MIKNSDSKKQMIYFRVLLLSITVVCASVVPNLRWFILDWLRIYNFDILNFLWDNWTEIRYYNKSDYKLKKDFK